MLDLLPAGPMLAAFIIASFLLGLTPGPDMALFLSETLKRGRAHGLAAFAGVSTGIGVHALLAAAGLSSLLTAAPTAYLALKIAGAFYLLYLAWRIAMGGGGLRFDAEPEQQRSSPWASYRRGVAINLLNPKIVVFFLTFLPQFIAADASNPAARFVVLGLLFLAVNTPTCVGIVFAAGSVRRWFSSGSRAARALDWLTAGAFTAFAARLAWSVAR